MFGEEYGGSEDPATGSANGCLAGYPVKYFRSSEIKVRVEQGYEIQRPSLLRLRASEQGDKIDVNVGGRCLWLRVENWSDGGWRFPIA